MQTNRSQQDCRRSCFIVSGQHLKQNGRSYVLLMSKSKPWWHIELSCVPTKSSLSSAPVGSEQNLMRLRVFVPPGLVGSEQTNPTGPTLSKYLLFYLIKTKKQRAKQHGLMGVVVFMLKNTSAFVHVVFGHIWRPPSSLTETHCYLELIWTLLETSGTTSEHNSAE